MTAAADRPPLLARINWYWTFQLAGWGALTLFNSVYGGASQLRIVVSIACWASLGGLLLSHLWHGILRRRGWAKHGLRWKRILPSLALLAAIQTMNVTAAFYTMYPADVLHGVAWLPGALLFWFAVFFVWTVFYFTVLSLRRAGRLEAETLQLQLQAREAELRALQPDLLLLDVQMPGASGFDLLAALDDVPDVIFCTAFDQYALQAFEVSALDYLQKPVQATRLAAALARAGTRVQAMAAPAPRKVFIKDGERCWFVPLDAIRLLESEGNYTRVFFDAQRPLMLRSLSQLEERLDPQHFFRANRRQIVNLAHIARVAANASEGLDLHLADGALVEVSRRRVQQFKGIASL